MSIFDKYDLCEKEHEINIPKLPEEGLILITGSSGSGKTTILKSFDYIEPSFNNDAIYKNFSTEENAEKFLIASGLRSVPTWKRTFNTLSNGEKHRALIALHLDKGVYFIDEFTSVVDRDTAKSLSYALSKHYKNSNIKRLIIASCHSDIENYLQPDFIYNTDLGQSLKRGLLRRPEINIGIKPCCPQAIWPIFSKHHYLSYKINKSCNAWVVIWNEKIIGFTSVIAYPSGTIKNAWRGHRTVILPEFQGLGIGNKVSNMIGQMLVNNGYRFFSKTSHPSMGLHREKSKLWTGTTKNKMKRKDYLSNRAKKTKEDGHKKQHYNRLCYSHEFTGEKTEQFIIEEKQLKLFEMGTI